MDGLLSAEDEALIRAEQRGADFGVLVEVGTGRVPADELERALGVVLAHWPSLAARVVRRGTAVTVRHDPPARVTDLAHLADLRGLTVLASRGDRLLRYRVDTQRRVLQLLGHHLVLDADSLDAFLADLDAVLAGRPLHGSGEWPWQPAPVPASPAVGRQARALPQGPLGGPGVEPTLVASRVPAPEEHAVRTLDAALADRVTAASRTCGVTPFGIYWAAAARIARADSARADTTPAHPTGSAAAHGAAALSTVVSSRLLSRTPQRCGNATTHLTVALGPAAAGRAGVRADFTDFTATWRGQRAAATVTAAPLLVSLSVAPTGCDLEVLGPVRLGPYVVKYEQHVQLQVVGDAVVVEAHDSRGLPWTGVADDASAGERLRDAFVTALSAVVDECLERPDGPAAPATPRTKRTMPATPVRSPRQAAAAVPSAAPDVATSALGRLLAAEPRLLVRDVGITSFDVLSVLDDLAVQHGVRVGVDTFYTWETAGDVQAVVAGPAPAVVEPAARPAADVTRVVLPHLSDVFIDAYRQGSADPYAVELAFVIDPALAVSVAHLAQHTRECLARHEVWRSRAGFSREGVVLDLDGPVTPVREVDAAAWKQVRDPRPLSVRPPARLADVAVARVGGELGVYVNVHHLLLDHVGLELLLADLLAGLRGETTAPATTWGQVLEPLHRARADAAEVWATDPVPSTLRPVGPSGGVTGGYVQHRLPWGVRAQDTLDLEAVLDGIVPAVAEFTGERRGLIGSVHHGRTVAGSDRLVGALARVLPATYDLDDPAVLRSGVRRLLAGQAALAADVGRGAAPTDPAGERRGATPGAALPMPVVVQVIRAGGTSGRSEHPGVLRRIAFEARTKFAVLLTLVADPDGDVLEVTLSTDHYDHDDLDRLVSLLAPLAPAASTAPLAPVTPIRTGAPA